METIKNKKTGKTVSYREKIYINGIPYISPTFKRKSDATDWKAEKRTERKAFSNGGITFDPSMTFEKFSHQWMESKKSEGLAQRSIDSYQGTVLKHLIPFFSDKLLFKITPNEGLQFRQHLATNTKLCSNRVNFILRVLKQIFNDALRWDYIIKNPFINLKFLKVPDRPLTYWTHQEIENFLNSNQSSEYLDLFEFALNTGLRKGELLGLCWDKVNFDRSFIEISRSVDRYGLKDKTKTGRIWHVPLNARAVEILSKRRSEKRHPSLVFTEKNSEPIKENHFSDRVFKKAVINANVKMIRLHDLRTCYASHFVMGGGDIFVLSKILGHTKVEMTAKRYAHLSSKHLVDQAEFFSTGKLNEKPSLKVLAQI